MRLVRRNYALYCGSGPHDPYPVHMIETINKLVRTGRQMLHEIGREPTPEELAEKLQMPLGA